MMKLPFHTTAKSTARLLMSIPSYWYYRESTYVVLSLGARAVEQLFFSQTDSTASLF